MKRACRYHGWMSLPLSLWSESTPFFFFKARLWWWISTKSTSVYTSTALIARCACEGFTFPLDSSPNPRPFPPPHLLSHLILHPSNGAHAPVHKRCIHLRDADARFQHFERLLAVCDAAGCEDHFLFRWIIRWVRLSRGK